MHNSFQSLKTLLFGKKKSFPGVQGVNNTLHREFPMVLSKSDLEVIRTFTEKGWVKNEYVRSWLVKVACKAGELCNKTSSVSNT